MSGEAYATALFRFTDVVCLKRGDVAHTHGYKIRRHEYDPCVIHMGALIQAFVLYFYFLHLFTFAEMLYDPLHYKQLFAHAF